MLKSIDPILAPELLWLLASMGHGGDVVAVDAGHPHRRLDSARSA
ncbi:MULTISPECIES: RbsD/FucU domain-containing protein [unclassified Bradyrhizobium]|nr:MULTISPECIES: RbsD/FucU domain-containing protein [unclassified Bradyrhizobium]